MSHGPGLEALQASLQDHLLCGDATIVGAVAARGSIGSAERLGIYRHAYRARLVDALRDTFGHTAAFLGEPFEAYAAAYVEAHPSDQASLRGYGHRFPAWIAALGETQLSELAALDRALRGTFDCADSPVMALADLAAVEPHRWGSAVLVLTRSYDRLRFEHNTLAIWQAIDDGQSPPPAATLGRAVDVLVWRRGLQPHFRSLGSFEAAALDHVRAGRDFGATCERLALDFPQVEVAQEAGRLLRRWVEEELLSSIG
jgi:Putative DNA-binding domain